MDHNKLIAKNAKETLKPLGFVRSGKSRIWFKDNGWWAVLIEFQPSSFSKGTYVNIAVNHFSTNLLVGLFIYPKGSHLSQMRKQMILNQRLKVWLVKQQQ